MESSLTNGRKTPGRLSIDATFTAKSSQGLKENFVRGGPVKNVD
jgi:hypothetical protein